ncbi:ABC transporter permease [Jeotgalibacillus marinus]|uniref:ABC transporter permease n=1 Tax=Jeotgalibacillus marinus TaxID=86667 RepID=A0ABV3Q2U4_9BACL
MLPLNRFGLIIAKTYVEKFKSKSFLITTFLFMLAIVVGTNFQTITDQFGSGSDRESDGWNIVIYDEEGRIAAAVEQQLSIVNQDITIEQSDASLADLEDQVAAGEYDALLAVSLQDNGKITADYLSESLTSRAFSTDLQLTLQTIQSNFVATELNLSADELAMLNMPVAFEQSSFSDTAKSETELNEARGLVYIMIFAIYMSVLIYSMMIATEVATEKSSRVMEILISSVSPVQQIFAKILGVGLLGLTQLAIWGTVGFASVQLSSDSMEGGLYSLFDFSSSSIETFLFGIVFFLLGYFLFATLAAFLGSLVSRIEDLQQMLMPVTLLVVTGAMLSFYGLADPEASFVTITSYIPFFSPLVMLTRVGMLNLPLWEPLLAIGLTVVTIIILGWFGAKVYRGGVLMYGNSSSFKDIKKALMISKKEK